MGRPILLLCLLICLLLRCSSFSAPQRSHIMYLPRVALLMMSDLPESPAPPPSPVPAPTSAPKLPKVTKPLTQLAQAIKDATPKEVKHLLVKFTAPVSAALTKFDNFLEKKNLKKNMTKEELSKLGLYALLSYGFVSNFSYITCVIIAWVIHGKSTGLSPLVKGQWKQFLAVYTGLYVANNFLRPFRFGVSVLIAPKFEDMIQFIMKKTNLKKAHATGVVVFLVNFCGTITYLIGGLRIATLIFGVPLRA